MKWVFLTCVASLFTSCSSGFKIDHIQPEIAIDTSGDGIQTIWNEEEVKVNRNTKGIDVNQNEEEININHNRRGIEVNEIEKEIEINQNNIETEIKQHKKELSTSQKTKSKKKITDLIDDVLYCIFDELELNDLTHMVEAIPKFLFVASETVRRNYPEINVQLVYSQHQKHILFHHDKQVDIFDFQLCLDALKHFGEVFQKIFIDYDRIQMCDRENVTKSLNNYTAKTLKQLDLGQVDEKVLNFYTVPFEEVHELSCHFRAVMQAEGLVPWNRLFPRLQRLILNVFFVMDINFINCEYPNLSHLSFEFDKIAWKHIKVINGLLQKNPQLKSLDIRDSFPPGFIASIAPLLPTLEYLTINSWKIGNGEKNVSFENVKHFELNTNEQSFVERLWLPSLESLTMMQYSTEALPSWKFFFGKHAQLLSHLVIIDPSYKGRSPLELNELTGDLRSLIDVEIQSAQALGNESIEQFIEKNKNLQKFCFLIPNNKFTKDIEDGRFERFKNEWSIQKCFDSTYVGLCFEKQQFY